MSDQDPPYQLLDAKYHFTPYYVPNAEASRFPGHATPHLHNSLHHPAQLFPEPRNQFRGSDPIMDARKDKPNHDEVASVKDVKDMTVAERHTYDGKEFTSTPPDALSQGQKQRWAQLFVELFRTQEETPKGKAEEDQDPYKIRPRGELRKLKQLAQLAGGKQE